MKVTQLWAILVTTKGGAFWHSEDSVSLMNCLDGYVPWSLMSSFRHFPFTQAQMVSIGLK